MRNNWVSSSCGFQVGFRWLQDTEAHCNSFVSQLIIEALAGGHAALAVPASRSRTLPLVFFCAPCFSYTPLLLYLPAYRLVAITTTVTAATPITTTALRKKRQGCTNESSELGPFGTATFLHLSPQRANSTLRLHRKSLDVGGIRLLVQSCPLRFPYRYSSFFFVR